jgi:hypothetical protein
MSRSGIADDDLELTTQRLGSALDAFAETLADSDRRLLIRLLLQAVDPIDRVRLLNPELLNVEQESLLAAIERGD